MMSLLAKAVPMDMLLDRVAESVNKYKETKGKEEEKELEYNIMLLIQKIGSEGKTGDEVIKDAMKTDDIIKSAIALEGIRDEAEGLINP